MKNAAICHGIKYEAIAVEQFELRTNLKTEECGIMVSSENPFIGSSPDRTVENGSLLEVKCPFTAKDSIITPASVPYLKLNESGGLSLDTKHDYFFQIQGQLYCSGRQQCYFVVYTLKDIKIITVVRNDNFIAEMVSKLKLFFHNFFKNAVISKFLHKDTHLYEFMYE